MSEFDLTKDHLLWESRISLAFNDLHPEQDLREMMIDELAEWLDAQEIVFSLRAKRVISKFKQKGFVSNQEVMKDVTVHSFKLYIEIPDPSQALLFKLTWL